MTTTQHHDFPRGFIRTHLRSTLRTWTAVLCGAGTLLLSATALADPPDRVARLTQIGGTVTFSPAGEEDWVSAEPNRPLTTGDRLWADAGSRVELQIGMATARLGENTSVNILNLDDRIGQFQLAQGTLNLRVRRIEGDQFYEIDTPTLAFSVRRDGDYRIDVDPSGNTTVIQVRAGAGDAWGEGTAYTIDAGQQYTFNEGFRDVRYDALPAADAFDRWCFDRDRRQESVAAARYVSPDVIGYDDLDEYGTWRSVEGYGNVWVPTRVATDWVPYHYGRWAWVEPWGWTWIDDEPWGFAPFHYGRWAYLSSRWCWVPGPVAVRAVYAPALVAFVGGGGFSIAIGGGPVTGVAWFPLGVGEVYRPAYAVSQTYFTNINITNTVINRTVVTNVYNNPNAEVRYRNRDVAGAVTAVPVNAFAGGERVDRHAVRVSRDIVDRQPVTPVAAVQPSHAAVIAAGAAVAGAAAAAHRPPRAALTRQVVARTEPPPPPASFAARARLLSEHPGRPLEPEKMQAARTERPPEAPRVKMVSPNVAPRALEKGPARGGAAPTGPAAKEERASKERKGGPQAGQVAQPPAAAQERMRQPNGRPAQGGPTAQEERALKERPGGPPQAAPGGPTAQEERASKERRPAPAERAPQPPATAQERFKGGPQQGQAPQQERAQQQRAQQERAQQAQQQKAQQQQERAQQQQERAQQAQQQKAQQQQERAQQQRAQQERAQQAQQQKAQQQQERAQQQRAQQEHAQQQRAQQERAQQQAQQERAQQAQQQRAQQERAQQEAAKQRAAQERSQPERAREKDKEQEHPPGQ